MKQSFRGHPVGVAMKKIIKDIAKKIPPLKSLVEEINQLRAELEALQKLTRPGQWDSPIPSIEEIKENEERVFGDISSNIPGIELNEKEQIRLLDKFKTYYNEIPFQPNKTENLRYFFENPAYSYPDAIFLYCMIRHIKPKKIIEVGCGYSSCAILDTNELFFDDLIEIIFIDPFPNTLLTLIKAEDKENIILIPQKVQDVSLREFESLEQNDILFIDSTHVSKIGSDVNYIFFEILPCLNSGVYIHFHDIFYPFEYPKKWIYDGKFWNEDYMLRAFLQYNPSFKIVFFNSFLEHFYKDRFEREMPLCIKNKGGSIWIQKC